MSAVVYVLIKGGEVLVEERQEGRFAGYWMFPTEKAEEGEMPQETLARGLKEEMGLKPKLYFFLGDIESDWRYLNHIYLVTEWVGEVPNWILDDNQNRIEWKDFTFMQASPLPGQREISKRIWTFMTLSHPEIRAGFSLP